MIFETAFGITAILSIILGVLCVKINRSKVISERSKSELESSKTELERLNMELEFKLNSLQNSDDHIVALSNRIISQNNEEFKRTATDPINITIKDLNAKIEKMTTENETSKVSLATNMEKIAETTKKDIIDLSSRVISQNNEDFKRNTTDPISTTIRDLNEKIEKMMRDDATSTASFDTHMKHLAETTKLLLKDTKTISDVLKNPLKHGRHAELGLERVFELSGLHKGIHYRVQETTESGRPDFIITLSEERSFIVDSKAPLAALWSAFNTDDEATRSADLDKHVQNVKKHINDLSKKEYWMSKESSIDYVIMVMHEYALMPALDRYPELTEYALERHVILVTPSTLMVLLHVVMLMWRERDLEQKIKSIGIEYSNIHKRLNKFAEYYNTTGKKLADAISSYNSGIRSWDRYILPGADRITQAGLAGNMKELDEIDKTPNQLRLSDTEPQ